MKKDIYKSIEIHNLLAIENNLVVYAGNDTYPKFLTSNGVNPIFKKDDKFFVATSYLVLYPKVHVSKAREKLFSDELITHYIQ